jgi:alpha/beta superfamily hydrolase
MMKLYNGPRLQQMAGRLQAKPYAAVTGHHQKDSKMESTVTVECGNIRLEGKYIKHSGTKGAVVCHPHPLYGGNMDNHVVTTIARVFDQKQISVLRFNFRGTGRSSGMFDNAEGEQEDVRAALAFMEQQGFTDLTLAGYSFGARINAAVVSDGVTIKDHIMVSPPAGFMSFDPIESMPDTGLIITGRHDEIAPPQIIADHIERWQIVPRFEIIENADHFYSGCLDDLSAVLTAYL